MKNKFLRNLIVKTLLILMTISNFTTVNASSIPNWKSLYQSKVQQIENEYKQGKRTRDEEYNISYYSLQDIDFDGVPELYHALVAKCDNGYELQKGTEEIYYIKNGRVVLGKIEFHDTLGLLPPLASSKTMADRNWQGVMYNKDADKVCFITKDSWSNGSDSGIVVISELKFDSQKGVLSASEISRGQFTKGSEPSYVSGYEMVSFATTFSIEKTLNIDIWTWDPPYVIAKEKEEKAPTTTAKTWQDYYKEFIINGKYLKSSQKFYANNSDGIVFALHDFNLDGIPEIVVKNGGVAEKDMLCYVYTYNNKNVTYLGKLLGTSTDFKVTSNSDYPGLYLENGLNGEYKGYYYRLTNNKIVEEAVLVKKVKYSDGNIDYRATQETTNDELYEICKNSKETLTAYTISEINRIGWDSFIKGAVQSAQYIYTDVPPQSWFYDAVEFVTKKGIMSGVSETKFDPNSEITRAMFVTMLYRLEKEPSTSRVNFKDVPKGSWYENAVSWAVKKNIATGVTSDNFAPNDKITRQQLMTILYRYAKYKNKNVSTDEYNIKCYLDNGEVSSYAVTPMNWAVGNELISGTSKYYLEPFGVANRVQSAVILQRFCEKYKL